MCVHDYCTAQHSTVLGVNLVGAEHPLDGHQDVLFGQVLPVELLAEPPELLHCDEAVVQHFLRPHGADALTEKLDHTDNGKDTHKTHI